jgi:intein/homing endonuclease
VEYNVPIVSATQTTRSGYSNSDLGLEDTSECIWVNEKVNLVDGSSKTMCDLVPGDQIISNDGFKTVMFVHHKKPKDCIKIKTKSGKEIIVSKEHIFPTNKGRVSYNTGLAIGTKLNVR